MTVLDNVISQNPTLTTHGFGVDQGCEDKFEAEREALRKCGKEFEICIIWLSERKHRKTVNQKIGTTYGLKHEVERLSENLLGQRIYIHEGALIAAALALEIEIEEIEGSTSAYLAISSRMAN